MAWALPPFVGVALNRFACGWNWNDPAGEAVAAPPNANGDCWPAPVLAGVGALDWPPNANGAG